MNPAGGTAGEVLMGDGSRGWSRDVTAPRWGKSITEKIAWCTWFLEKNPRVYDLFEKFANQWQAARPGGRISADAILQRIRWETTVRAVGDVFEVNNNARAVLVRLYCTTDPSAKFEQRKCWLDVLSTQEWQQILAAHERGQGYAPKVAQ